MSKPNPQQPSTPRARGNAFFTSGNFAAAAAAYSEGLPPNVKPAKQHSADHQEHATLLSNRAACLLELGDSEGAAADCRSCLQLDPTNAKAYYRLARALPPDHEDAARSIAIAFALIERSSRTPQMLQLYDEIRQASPSPSSPNSTTTTTSTTSTATATSASLDATAAPTALKAPTIAHVDLPVDPFCISCASSWMDVEVAVSAGATIVVLRPGSYMTNMQPPRCRTGAPYALLAAGPVELDSSFSHVIWVTEAHPPVTIFGAKLAGSGRGAAACASGPGAVLQLVDCVVQEYEEVAVLAVEGATARLHRCTFQRCARHAVEVREGAYLEASHCTMSECRQGVSAYGGARSVVLRHCTITQSHGEGVLLNGSYFNAASEFQSADRRRPKSERSLAVTEAANEWARRTGTPLDATILYCTISQCTEFGISADTGANVIVRGCRLEANDPYNVFIKGGTNVSLLGCLLSCTGRPAQSKWLTRAAALPGGGTVKAHHLRQGAVRVGVNYGGNVNVVGCAFVGPEDLAIMEEIKYADVDKIANLRRIGMWSKPVMTDKNTYHDKTHDVRKPPTAGAANGSGNGSAIPTLEALQARLPTWLLNEDSEDGRESNGALAVGGPHVRKGASAAAVPVALLRRTCYSYSQTAWAPTAHEYYAIGNTLGYDVTSGLLPPPLTEGDDEGAPSPPPPLSVVHVLLGACGDVRNLLATAHGVLAPGGGRRLAVTLNDGNLSMLARDAVLLYLAAELAAPPEAVLAVWANHGLSEAHGELLTCALRALAEKPWPAWLKCAGELDGYTAAAASGVADAAERPLRDVFSAWLIAARMPLKEFLKQRDDWMGRAETVRELRRKAVNLSMEVVRTADKGEELHKQVEGYIQTGSLTPDDGEAVVATNSTLLLAPALQYTVYFSTSIFRALPLAPITTGTTSAAGKPSTTAWARLLASLTPQLATAAAALRNGSLSVSLLHGDILATMLAPTGSFSAAAATTTTTAGTFSSSSSFAEAAGLDVIAPEHAASHSNTATDAEDAVLQPVRRSTFDFIDCSNVADYVSLQALVQATVPLLAPVPYARLRMESILLYGAEKRHDLSLTPSGFVESQLGVSLAAFQELLGVRFVGGKELSGMQRCLRMEWVLTEMTCTTEEERMGPNSTAGGSGHVASAADGTAGGGGSNGTVGSAQQRPSWMTGPRLLLELLPAVKCFFSTSSVNGAVPPCAPLALVHLLALAAPRQVDSLVRAFIRCDSTGIAALFKWELTLQAQLHHMSLRNRVMDTLARPVVRCVSYGAKPAPDLFLLYDTSPMLLAVSRIKLPLGPLGTPAAAGCVKQLISSFAWDEELATAHVLLPDSISEQCGNWYLTLCVLLNDTVNTTLKSKASGGSGSSCTAAGGTSAAALAAAGLVVVGESAVISTLPVVHSVTGGGSLTCTRWRPLRRDVALHLDLTLVDQLGGTQRTAAASAGTEVGTEPQHPQHPKQSQPQQPQLQWQGNVHRALCPCPGGGAGVEESLTVDVLAPGPLPPASEAPVTTLVEGGTFHVSVGVRGGGGGRGQLELSLSLPKVRQGVYGKAESVKLSRKLGLLSARVDVRKPDT